ncbi:hypothetical protein JCM15764A_07670 [Geotalea toluenoxydans]
MKRIPIPAGNRNGLTSFPVGLVFLAMTATFSLSGCTESQSSPAQAKAFAAATTAKQAETVAAPAAAAFAKTSSAAETAAKVANKTYTSARAEAKSPKGRYLAGEDPAYAKRCGWPVKCAEPLPGSILPRKRIVAYYGIHFPNGWAPLENFRRTTCCAA